MSASARSAARRPISRSRRSYFTEVRPVGPVGDDFGEAEYDVLRRHG